MMRRIMQGAALFAAALTIVGVRAARAQEARMPPDSAARTWIVRVAGATGAQVCPCHSPSLQVPHDRELYIVGVGMRKILHANSNGFEVAYDTFFDFLPKPFDGFGIQANYTYVKNSGITNTNLGPPNSPTNTNAGNKNTSLDPGALEGISKHTFNLVGLYEKGRISARVAYNWRSKYLVTAVDCCVYLPVWQKASGYLDASIRYRLTDSIELSLEGSNLLNTKTVLLQQVTDKNSPEGKIILTPNGWFQNDRRFIVGVRWKMASAAAPVAPPPVALPPPPPPAATQTCADGSVILATAACPAPPPPPPAAAPERGF